MTKYTKTTTKLNKNNIGQKVQVFGWVKKIRKLGELIFFDLRDTDGILQVFVDKHNSLYDKVKEIHNEYVLKVEGIILERKNINNNIYSGYIELILENIEIINEAKTTPLIIDEQTDALEPKRLEYRYLDIRRENVKNALLERSKFNKIIRDYFYDLNFKEIETPILTKKTPGGAGEFLVKSKKWDDLFYVLVQSPQIYKQLLMYGGIDKYFQIAKCFRDEDSRSDRQLEFTQLDLEILWTDELEIQNLIEKLFVNIFKKMRNIDLTIPFKRIDYKDAMEKYGSDKPDLRIAQELNNLTSLFNKVEIQFVKNAIANKDEVIGIVFPDILSSSFLKTLSNDYKTNIDKSFAWLTVENKKIVSSSIKDISSNDLNIFNSLSSENKFTLVFANGELESTLEFLGKIRVELANKLELVKKDVYEFCWVVNWPLFEFDQTTKKIVAKHNPFTSIAKEQEQNFLNTNLKNHSSFDELKDFKARSYDVVLNGNEVGGGSIRFSKKNLQTKAFEMLGLTQQEQEKYFGWFLESFDYGTPFHGGIALGLDRILQLILNENSIRDVIAFPKLSSGLDILTKAPTKD